MRYSLLDIKTTPNGRTPQAATMVRMDIQPRNRLQEQHTSVGYWAPSDGQHGSGQGDQGLELSASFDQAPVAVAEEPSSPRPPQAKQPDQGPARQRRPGPARLGAGQEPAPARHPVQATRAEQRPAHGQAMTQTLGELILSATDLGDAGAAAFGHGLVTGGTSAAELTFPHGLSVHPGFA